jgi:cyclin B
MINSTSHNSYYNRSKSNRNSNKSEDKVKYKIKEEEKVKEFQYQDHKTIANVKKNDSNRIKIDKKEMNENKENRTMENIEKKESKIRKEIKIKKDKKEKIRIIERKPTKEIIEKKEIKNIHKNVENKEKTIKTKEEKKNNKRGDNNNNNVDDDENEVKIKYFDISNINNIQIPKEYINVIYYNLLKEEEKGIKPMPDYTYMSRQNEINEKMRSILVDWIIDVHFKFGFTDETLFMTVSIIDRYLSICQITRTNFQLLGITALMIACKHEEIDLPKIDDFIYITDNAYVKDEVIKMEEDVLSKLNFAFLYPSPIKFFEYLSLHFKFEKKHHMMGKYLMESFLLDVKNAKYKPSIISCACAYIVMKFFKMANYHDSYNKKFYVLDETVEKYSEHNIKECAKDICLLVDNINKTNYQACSKKYSKPEQEKVSIIIMNN